MRKTSPLGVTLGAILLASALAPERAAAQAWVPAPRTLSVYTGYQYQDAGDHLVSQDVGPAGDNRIDWGDISGQTVLFGLDYGITERLAASAGAAYVASKYEGVDPDNLDVDNGSWNNGIQDLTFGLRYMAIRAPVVVTPTLQLSVPSHSYETLGHAALGRDLNELRMGLSLGWAGRSFLPGTYVHTAYSFAFVEAVEVEPGESLRANRSDLSMEAGYFVTPKFAVRASAGYLYTHDGIDWLDPALAEEAHFHDHDRLAKAKLLTAGGGVSYAFGPGTVAVGVITGLSGENTHDSTSFLVSMGRTFDLSR